MDSQGDLLVRYTYDAWGNFTESVKTSNSGALAALALNPFRYRGYVYDFETGFYYLQSRYYDPQTGRFISPDDTEYLGANGDLTSYNLFAYCSNNPVMYTDPTGHFVILPFALFIGIAISAGAGATMTNGMLSFVGGMVGGITGVKIPGKKQGAASFFKYHGGLTYFGVYPTKVLISKIKNSLQEICE